MFDFQFDFCDFDALLVAWISYSPTYRTCLLTCDDSACWLQWVKNSCAAIVFWTHFTRSALAVQPSFRGQRLHRAWTVVLTRGRLRRQTRGAPAYPRQSRGFMLVVRPPLITLGLCSVRAAEHGSCRNIILLRTRRQTNKTSHLLLLVSQTVFSLYRRRMPIYYTMITSLTRNASILSGGRGLRLLWLKPGNQHRAT